jgi:hypothetical protein
MKTAKAAIEIRKLELGPGDVLVVRAREVLSAAAAEHIKGMVEPLVPDGVKVLVIDRQIDLSMLTRAENDARTA